MQVILGWILIVFPGLLFLAQLISSVNFELAQRLGIQEKSGTADKLLLRAERYVAYWDLVTLVWMPVAGVLMVVDHLLWPFAALIGSAMYFDAAGREAAKNLSFRHEGIKMGTEREQRFFYSYYVMAILALVVAVYSLSHLLSR